MEYSHHIKTYRSFRKSEFEEYFSNIGERSDAECFYGEGWIVELGQEENPALGSFTLIQVKIELWLRQDIEERFLEEMKNRFLRGGG